jgi:serine/threonine protein kinase
VHKLGKVYNDLKLENILIGDQNNSLLSLSEIRLIDFGLVTDYLDGQGNHIEFEQT